MVVAVVAAVTSIALAPAVGGGHEDSAGSANPPLVRRSTAARALTEVPDRGRNSMVPTPAIRIGLPVSSSRHIATCRGSTVRHERRQLLCQQPLDPATPHTARRRGHAAAGTGPCRGNPWCAPSTSQCEIRGGLVRYCRRRDASVRCRCGRRGRCMPYTSWPPSTTTTAAAAAVRPTGRRASPVVRASAREHIAPPFSGHRSRSGVHTVQRAEWWVVARCDRGLDV